MKEVPLPSGAVLKMGDAPPFADARDLHQALLRELRNIPLMDEAEGKDLIKNMVTAGFSSKEVEKALWKCLPRYIYVPADQGPEGPISMDTFEPVEARLDYVAVCIAVGKEVVGPFLKSLFVEYSTLLGKANEKSTHEQRGEKMTSSSTSGS